MCKKNEKKSDFFTICVSKNEKIYLLYNFKFFNCIFRSARRQDVKKEIVKMVLEMGLIQTKQLMKVNGLEHKSKVKE